MGGGPRFGTGKLRIVGKESGRRLGGEPSNSVEGGVRDVIDRFPKKTRRYQKKVSLGKGVRIKGYCVKRKDRNVKGLERGAMGIGGLSVCMGSYRSGPPWEGGKKIGGGT